MARSTLRLSPADPRIAWDGLGILEEAAGAWRPWRVDPARLASSLSPGLIAAARATAGVRFALRTDARSLSVNIRPDGSPSKPVDVFVAEQPVVRVPLSVSGDWQEVVVDLPGAPSDVEVWLPHNVGVRLGPIELAGHGIVQRPAEPEFSWTAHGSSLTQSLAATGPSRTWTALVAKRRGWRLLNLGLAGEAHLDQSVARVIRDRPADLITLGFGINVYILASLGPRALGSAVTGFIQTVRDGHPRIPIIAVSPPVSSAREDVPNAVGLTLRHVRACVAEAVEFLRSAGDPHLHLLNGPDLLSADDAGLLMDGLHPSADGEVVLAERFDSRLDKLAAHWPATR
jgi:lysophospholipase L1-like esterase